MNIVDPRKIIKSVEEVISSLQKELNMEFSSGTTLGIYIHICCLIERTIIDKEPASYNNLDDFINNHKDFIRLAKKIFLEIELSYNVTIPESEIAYLFDYIYSEKRPGMSKLKSNYNNDLFEFNE
ncbi:MAG: PRD domain-containing protein [Anaerobutyricum soehngenii]